MSKKKQEALFPVSPFDVASADREHCVALWAWNLNTEEVYFSPCWKKMLGFRENELDDQLNSWTDRLSSQDRDELLAKVHDCLSDKIEAFEIEMSLRHKDGHEIAARCRAHRVYSDENSGPHRLVGSLMDVSEARRSESYTEKTAQILELIAIGSPATEVYDAIALMYEGRHSGLRCSMLELDGDTLLHGGAPSLPKAYCDAVNGLKNGPDVGSCGTSTYTGERCLVENIETDPKWANIKQYALPHGMRCCWSEPIKNSSGKVLGAFGMYYDYPALPNEHQLEDLVAAGRLAGIVMQRDQDQKRITELAYTDELTRLASRAHFYKYLEELAKTSRRYGREFDLLYIDLDDFKDINDSLGHDVGDQLLLQISQRLMASSRETDFVARIGGDEFCMLVESAGDGLSAASVAQHCLEVVSNPIKISTRRFTPACSIGIAHYPDDGADPQSLVKAADTALYEAKKRGKNRYAFYQLEMTRQAEYSFQVEGFLREAIEQEKLTLVYQPQVDILSREIIGVEALCRWYHPTLGQVSPVEFIEIAERIGMIKPLTNWVMKTACQQAIAWEKAGLGALKVAVNISPSHFLDKDIVSLVKTVLKETGLPPNGLELEVTESVVQTDPKNLSVFKELKELGVMLAIDDFGTGYSSFASLKHLSVDSLKIDRYFIDDMVVDEQSKVLVHSMVEMGRNLGHEIIAEGVETSEQLDILKDMNCEIAQGFLFCTPVAPQEIVELLEKSDS